VQLSGENSLIIPGIVAARVIVPWSIVKPDPVLEARLADLVRQLTPAEKIGLIPTRQEAVPRLGLPEFWIGGEAAHGLVARDGPTTVFCQTLGLSSTWDPALVEKVGAVAGDEARGYHRSREGLSGLCLWAPTVDLERDPRWGRTEEGWGEDPVLTGILASAYVRGLQGRHPTYLKTVATLKHFFANNHEAGRTSTSSDIPPVLMEGYYLKAFELVLRNGAQSIMTAYNAVNGVPAMLRPEIHDLVKGQWGWDGFVVCDGGALSLLVSDHRAFGTWAEAVAASLKAGIDCFPEDGAQLKPALHEALDRGLIDTADLDRAVTRTLRARLRLGLFAEPGDNPYEALTTTVIHRPESRALAREAAVKAAVLLKNDGILPFSDRALGSVAVVGPLADAVYRDWYTGTAAAPVSPLRALVEMLGTDRVVTADGCDLVALRAPDGQYIGVAGWNDPGLVADRPTVQPGELYRRTDWGWGTQTFQALANGNFVTTDDARVEASAKEVWGWFTRERFGAASSGPGPWLTWRGDPVSVGPEGRLVVGEAGLAPPADFSVEVVRNGLRGAVAAARSAEAAVVFVGNHPLINGRETEDRPSLALAPDQVSLIRAVAQANPRTVVVIVGSYPFAIGDWQDEVGAVLFTTHGGQEAGHAVADLLFGDAAPGGRLSMTWYQSADDLPPITDYDIETRGRTHLYYQGTPLYPFGHGLSYTTFSYKGLRWDSEAQEASVVVTNTGPRTGDEVVQFYQGRALVGFARITLAPGENRLVRCALPRNAVRSPALPFTVGSSSTDLRLTLEPQGML
jgi:beta-glucosidase